MAAYHMEALRRQRVIDTKVEALTRIEKAQEAEALRIQEENERVAREMQEEEEAQIKEREEHLRQRGGNTQGNKCNHKSILRELKYQEKVLRDHGLVMGNVKLPKWEMGESHNYNVYVDEKNVA